MVDVVGVLGSLRHGVDESAQGVDGCSSNLRSLKSYQPLYNSRLRYFSFSSTAYTFDVPTHFFLHRKRVFALNGK